MTYPCKTQGKTQHVAPAAHDAMHQNAGWRRPADAASCTPLDLPKEVAGRAQHSAAQLMLQMHNNHSYQGPLNELVRKKIRFSGGDVAGRLHQPIHLSFILKAIGALSPRSPCIRHFSASLSLQSSCLPRPFLLSIRLTTWDCISLHIACAKSSEASQVTTNVAVGETLVRICVAIPAHRTLDVAAVSQLLPLNCANLCKPKICGARSAAPMLVPLASAPKRLMQEACHCPLKRSCAHLLPMSSLRSWHETVTVNSHSR